MPNTIAGRKRKVGDFEGAISGDRYAHLTTRGCSTNPSETRETRSLKVYSSLCRRCARLDLDKILSRPHKTASDHLVVNLGPVSTWSIDSCSFCILLYSLLPPDFLQPSVKPSLFSYSSNRISDLGWKSINKNLLRISGSSEYIVPQAVDAKGPIRMLEQDSIDFDVLKNWISICRDLHTKVCAVEASSPVPFLKMIDCETRKIIPATNDHYVALSYVWGQISSPSSLDPECLPEDLPRTIEDSITVTRKLGFRYLWIDRYCINQQLQEEVNEQVQKMDLIYQNAQVTIIACAGEDPKYGLPGMGYRKRHPQACATVGKHLMVSALSDPREFIEASKWSTRAWTYQEALLSRRRLVFTDQQVYYECHGMYCCEAMDFPLLDLHTKDRQSFKKVFCQGERIGIFPKGVGRSPWEVVERIEQYSRLSLNLKEPSDILKGILGILNAFERSTFRIHHYAGVPLLPSCPKMVEFLSDNWTSAMSFFSGLCWTLERPSSRRAGFPSWSWTGWNVPVKWGYENYQWQYIRVDNNVQVGVELANRRILDWELFRQLQATPKSALGLTNFIHISAWTSSLRILRHRSWQDPDEYEAKIKLEDGGYILWRFKSTTNIPFLPNQLATGIHLAHESRADGYWAAMGPALMVVGHVGSVTERIGFGWVDQVCYKEFDKSGDSINRRGLMNPNYLPPLRLVKSWQRIRLG